MSYSARGGSGYRGRRKRSSGSVFVSRRKDADKVMVVGSKNAAWTERKDKPHRSWGLTEYAKFLNADPTSSLIVNGKKYRYDGNTKSWKETGF